MPKETGIYERVLKHDYEFGNGGGIAKEVIRTATQDEFNNFMKLHDSSLYKNAQDVDELDSAIKENFDIKNKNNLTLTRVDIDTADGRHHVVFELASKINDYHTVAVHDEDGLILRDGFAGYKQGVYINNELREYTAKYVEGGNEGGLLSPLQNTEYLDHYHGGLDNGQAKLFDFFDIDQNPSSIKILHDVVPHDYLIG